MAARPRIKRRANWPANLHEPRPGYFTWRDPRDEKTHILGRISLAEAIFQSQEANVVVEKGTVVRSLADRVMRGNETVSDLLDKMPTEGFSKETLDARRGYDRLIRTEIGHVVCAELTTRHVSDLLEKIKERGKMRWAQAIRSRINAMCKRGVALGWMATNPASVTDSVKVNVKRRRMTLEEFKKILEKAPEVAPWLPNAMLLALVSGQDRLTVGRWERSFTHGDVAIILRSKTKVRIAIPLSLRLNAINLSLGEVISRCKKTGVVSKYLIHHVRSYGNAKRGDGIKIDTISEAFSEARILAKVIDEHAPTFHEIRSLSKRLYDAQGGVDTKSLLGHSSEKMANLYTDMRDAEPIKVKINGA